MDHRWVALRQAGSVRRPNRHLELVDALDHVFALVPQWFELLMRKKQQLVGERDLD
jgi:hypothetical protein